MSTIVTASGRAFPLESPTASHVDPQDIAVALSHLCRFGGHVRSFYSVAQHSVLVSVLAGRLARLEDLEAARWGLLHDATEAYLGDVVSPLKRLLPGYQLLEAGVLRAVAQRFRLDGSEIPPVVHRADAMALALEAEALTFDGGSRHVFVDLQLAAEARGLLGYFDLVPRGPADARELFSRHAILLGLPW